MRLGGEEKAAEGTAKPTAARVLLLVPARTYRAADFLLAAARLGLDLVVGTDGALPLEAVIAATDKAQQRRRWADARLPQPGVRIVPATASADSLRQAAAQVGFPCVVKAVSLSASQGILRANDPAGAVAAAGRIRRILAAAGRPGNEPLLIEEYVPGWELSIDGLLDGGDLAVTAVFDKPGAPEGPTFEETLLITPSRLPGRTVSAAVSAAEHAASALGLRYGPIHAELRIDDRCGQARPVMLELAARCIGGLCSRALRFPDGHSLEELVLASALGQRVSSGRLPGTSGVLMLPIERPGVLRAVDGRAEAAAVPGITGLTITVPIGQPVHPLPEGDRYLGFVFAEGEDYQQVERALGAARKRLGVVIR